jgi:hypothetical protein
VPNYHQQTGSKQKEKGKQEQVFKKEEKEKQTFLNNPHKIMAKPLLNG